MKKHKSIVEVLRPYQHIQMEALKGAMDLALEELAKKDATSNKRVMKIFSGCKTNGIIDLSSDQMFPKVCSDPECTTCVRFMEGMKQAAKHFKG